MGYTIEISIHLLKHANISEIKKVFIDVAVQLGCIHFYDMFEYQEKDKQHKFPRNHCIMSFLFSDTDTLCKFIIQLKTYKSHHIECIYNDEPFHLIYASSYYLTTLEKDKARKYKHHIYSEDEQHIMSSL